MTAVIHWASILLVLAAIIGVLQFTIWAGACLLAEGWRCLRDLLDRRRLDRCPPDLAALDAELTPDRRQP
jgi:hypothetical protein